MDILGETAPLLFYLLPPGALYFVWTYSERQHLSCFTSYEVPLDGFSGREKYMVTLDPARAENFGGEMRDRVQVVPFDRSLRRHAEEYLHLLDWRTEVHFPLTHNVIAGQTFHDPKPPSTQTQDMGVEINFAGLREDVGRRHQRVDLFLWLAMGLLLAVTIKGVFDLGRLHGDFVRALPGRDYKLTYARFLGQDLDALLRQEQKRQREQQDRVQEEARVRRERELMTAKLHYVQEMIADEPLRARITAVLAGREPEVSAMKGLWEEVQRQPSYKSADEKLSVLLDSFSEYCSVEEWQQCKQESLMILEESGFRAAREYAVRMHDLFRERAKKQEQEKAEES